MMGLNIGREWERAGVFTRTSKTMIFQKVYIKFFVSTVISLKGFMDIVLIIPLM